MKTIPIKFCEMGKKGLPLTLLMPADKNCSFISFKITLKLFNINTVAIPDPIRPPPTIAAFLIFRGVKPMLVIFGIWW